MTGTPARDRQPGRAVPTTAETPDLVADVAEILPMIFPIYSDPEAGTDADGDAVDIMNRLAEFGWQVVRLP